MPQNNIISLTQEERDKFAAYLEQEAATDEILMKQAKKIDVPEVMLRKYRLEILSSKIVAAKLQSWETF